MTEKYIQQCRNAMVEYEMADSGISQVLSQDNVDRAALFVREGVVFAKLVHGVLSLCLRKLMSKYP